MITGVEIFGCTERAVLGYGIWAVGTNWTGNVEIPDRGGNGVVELLWEQS